LASADFGAAGLDPPPNADVFPPALLADGETVAEGFAVLDAVGGCAPAAGEFATFGVEALPDGTDPGDELPCDAFCGDAAAGFGFFRSEGL
jgi:hypothetical protein